MCKVFNVWPKKIQRSYLSWHWRVMRNLKKNWLVVWKITWGIWQIFTRAIEISKLAYWWDPLIQSKKSVSLKFREKLCVMTIWRMMQNLERNWLVISKFTRRIWWILTRGPENLNNFNFDVLLLSKVYIVWGKKVQRSYISWNWREIQNLERKQPFV